MVPMPNTNNYFFFQGNHTSKQQVKKQVSNNLSRNHNSSIKKCTLILGTRYLDIKTNLNVKTLQDLPW